MGAPCSLQTAVSLSADGDEIRAAAGTYTNTGSAVITLTLSLSLTGGYDAGDWNAPPNPQLNPTILDGESSRRVIGITGNVSPIIQNFIIENGRAPQGAGIYNESGTPIIRNNEIHSNATDADPRLGSGIFDGGYATIEGNEIHDNSDANGLGGGVVIQNGGTSATQLRLNNIHDNQSQTGGGVYVRDGSSAFLEANEIYNNSAEFGGGLYAFSGGSTAVTLYSNLFHHNTATNGDGGAIYTWANGTYWNNTVADNSGGSIYVLGAAVQISNTIIAFNDGGTNDGIVNDGGTVTGGYNNIYSDTNSSGVTLTNPINGDPAFVERAAQPFNYHLLPGSPDINTGTTSPALVDIDGQTRPFNTLWDVGADEYGDLVEVLITPPDTTRYDNRGTTAVYTHTVRNNGNLPDSYTFTCNNASGWAVTCPAPLGTLNPQETAIVNTMIDIPTTAVALEESQTTVQVISNLSATVSSTAVINTIVNPQPGLHFTPSYSETVLPGDIITFTHYLTNTGDSADTFTLQMLPGSEWAELLPTDPYVVPLGIGDSRLIQVRVTVPPEAPAGLADIAQIRAVSSYDVDVSAIVTDTITAKPTTGTRYVTKDGHDTNNNCTVQENPCETIGYAVLQASFGDEIHIGSGIYQESDIPINDAIHISGGWTADFKTQLDPDKTVIDAQGAALILNIAPGSAIAPSISNLTLRNGNSAGAGGAVLVGSFAQPTLEKVIFENNHAPRGGAVYADTNALVTIRKSQFINNTVNTWGGALYAENSTILLQQSSFYNNTAPNDGGAVFFTGGQLEAQNNLFAGNASGSNGGGVYAAGGLFNLINNTFVQNDATGSGGGLYNDGATVTAVNNIFSQNTAASGEAIFQGAGGSTDLSYSNLWQNDTIGVTTGSGNISADPLFIDAAYRLGRGSPSLDIATPTGAPGVDFEDDPRPSDAGYDMGYDELAGCRAQRDGIAEPFGSIQEAIAADADSMLIRVTGICRGVSGVDMGGSVISQTVYLTQSFTIQGGWKNDFSAWTNEPTYVDPEGAGRGFYISGPVTPVIESLYIINGNAAGLGGGPGGEDAGGGVYNLDSSTIFIDVRILTSTATLGGGFYNHTGAPSFHANAARDDLFETPYTHIAANTAVSGGGIYNHAGALVVDGARLYGNTAVSGGALYNDQGDIFAANAAIYENTASGSGGGIYNNAAANYWHLTVYSNTAALNGGGFYNAGSDPVVHSAIFQSNQASSGPAVFVNNGSVNLDYNYYHAHTAPAVVGAVMGPNDVLDDINPPGLTDPLGGNFHLLDTAAAADLGDPAAPVPHDFEGDLRPSNQAPDIGADELAGCLVKLNDDGPIFGSIQAAMLVAQTGDTLNVSGVCSGVHAYNISTPSACSDGSGDMLTTVHIDKNVHLVGGWDNIFDMQDEDTFLDAQGLGRVVYVAPGITATVEGFHIINGAADNGGGICIDNAAPGIFDNKIYSNTAASGGAIYSLNSNALIDKGNRITLNQATNGAAVAASGSAATTVQNNFVYSNTAASGGAFYNESGDHNFWHNTIYANSASGNGGAVYAAAGSPSIRSNIVMSNSSGIFGQTGSTPGLDYNDYVGNGSDVGGTAVIGPHHLAVDPEFKDLPGLNFTIFYTSPVADMGDPTLPITGDFQTDIRPSHQGFDIGADEVGGCFARVLSDPDTIYGSVQTAVDAAPNGDTVQVDGTCYGVNVQNIGQEIRQTVYINKDLTLDGDWDYQNTGITATLDALYRGRVLFVANNRTVTVTNIILLHGDAATAGLQNGSGGAVWNDGDLTLLHANILTSTATNGGGVYNNDTLTVRGATFNGDTAVSGGALYQGAGHLVLDGNRFFGNEADNGGAIYLAGTAGILDVWNNFIHHNTANSQGAGVYNANTDGRIWHNSFIFNNGDGLYSAAAATDDIRSNIFDRNSGAGIHTTAASPAIDYNNVYSNGTNYAGTAVPGPSDISSRPIYRDEFNRDYHLTEGSPGADTADPALPAANLDHDIDGDIRPTNGGPDMGADEINSCLIRVDTEIFGVFQEAIDYAENNFTAPFPDIEMARGACRGVQLRNGTLQVGYISENLNIIGSLRRSNFSDPNDYHNPDVGAVSSVIDAQNEGRVIVIANNAEVHFTHVAIVGGNAYATDSNDNGGGIYNADGGSFTTSESQTCQNSAQNGGGYYGASGTSAYFSGAGTGDCWVARFDDKDELIGYEAYDGNTANDGAGFYVANGAQVDITNHGMDDNSATNNGGVVYNNGQMTIINGLFWSNDAGGNGGAVYNIGDLEMLHNTLRDNIALGQGGGVYNGSGTTLHINSTIVVTNTSSSGGGGVHSLNGGTSSYNNFFQNMPADVSGFTLDANTRIGDPGLGYLYLNRHSRNIDVADPALLQPPYSIDFDADNLQRPDGPAPHNGLHGTGSDIGALEYWKDFGCDIRPNDQHSTVSPGDVVTYTIGIYNVGNPSVFDDYFHSHGFTDTLTVTLASQTQGWSVLGGGALQSITLDYYDYPNFEYVTRTLTVTVPADAPYGISEVSELRCESGSIPGRVSVENVRTDVGLVNLILVEPEYITVADPGDVMTFTHWITNLGNASGDFLMIPSAGAAGLSTAAVTRIEEADGNVITSTTGTINQPVTLDVGQVVTAFLKVNILDTAAGGETANPGLIARDTADPTVQGQVINQILISYTTGTRYVAIGGIDEGNNCTDVNQPCATMQRAVDQAADGDPILVASGVYTDSVTRTVGIDVLDQNLFIDKSVVIQGGYSINDGFTTVQPITNAVVLDAEGLRRGIYVADGVTVTVSNLFVQNGLASPDSGLNGSTRPFGGGVYNAGANLTISGVWVLTNTARYGGGLYHLNGSLTVNNSAFAHNSNNTLLGPPGEGGGLYVENGLALLENNTFVDNVTYPDDGVEAFGGAVYLNGGEATILNHIFSSNINDAVFVAATAVITNDFNLFDNQFNKIVGGSPGPNSITGTAVFIDSYFHIGVDSDAKDTGTPLVTIVGGQDFDMEARVQGPGIDIGADERTQNASFIFEPISQTVTINPGAVTTFTHRLTNTGDFSNVYTLTMSHDVQPPGGTGWGYTLSPTATGSLNSGDAITVTLVVTGGTAGYRDATTIVATNDFGNSRSVLDTTIISQTAGVDIDPSRSGSGDPGTQVIYTHTLTNTGDGADMFLLRPITTTAVPPDWPISVTPTTTGFLLPGEQMPFTTTVTIPPGTTAGSEHVVTFEAAAVSDPTVTDTLMVTTTVNAANGLMLFPDNSGTSPDNATAVYTHTLQNIGNITDTITLTGTETPAWGVAIAPPTATLAPAEMTTVVVSVTVPPGTGGQVHVATITAVSSNPVITATAVDTTTVGEVPGVLIAPDHTRDVAAGTTEIYTHTVTNLGNVPDTFTLTHSSSLGWLDNVVHDPLTLAPGGTAVVTATVIVPAGALAGQQDVTVITATSGLDADVFDTATDISRIPAAVGLIFEPDNEALVSEDSVVTYTHHLTNTGNQPDTFSFAATSSQGWATDMPAPVDLNPDATTSIVVTLTVPAGTGGLVDIMQVTATSAISPAISASVTNTTTVIMPAFRDVIIAPDNQGTGAPGDTLTYTHTVTNTGDVPDTFTLSPSSSLGWVTAVTPTNIALANGASAQVTVTVTIPGGATNGQIDTTTVTAVSDTDPMVSDTAEDVTIVQLPPSGVLLEPDNAAQGLPGETIVYAHTLTNTGSISMTFLLTATSGQGWAAAVNPTQIDDVLPGVAYPVTVTVTISDTAVNGEEDFTTVVAVGATDPGVTDLAVDHTTVAINYGVMIAPNNAAFSEPNQQAVYAHTITNTGNYTETFALSAASSQGWVTAVAPTAITLGANESGPVAVTVTVPAGVVSGTVDVTTVTAVSTAPGSNASDNASDTTTISYTVGGPTTLYLPVIMSPCGDPTGVDLVVTNIVIHPNPPTGGQAATVFVTIRNQGTVDMTPGNNFYLDFYVDRVPAPFLVGDIQWGVQAEPLTAGASVTYEGQFTFSGGAHQVWAQVDTDNTVNECPDENNNVMGPITVNAAGAASGDGHGQIAPPVDSSPRQTPTPGAPEAHLPKSGIVGKKAK